MFVCDNTSKTASLNYVCARERVVIYYSGFYLVGLSIKLVSELFFPCYVHLNFFLHSPYVYKLFICFIL